MNKIHASKDSEKGLSWCDYTYRPYTYRPYSYNQLMELTACNVCLTWAQTTCIQCLENGAKEGYHVAIDHLEYFKNLFSNDIKELLK